MCRFEYKNTILDGDQRAHGRPYPPLCNPFSIASSTIYWYNCTRTHMHTRYVQCIGICVTRSTLPVSGWFVLCRIRAIIFNTERVKVYVLLQSRRNPRVFLSPGKNQDNFTVRSFYVTVVFFIRGTIIQKRKKKFVQQSSSLHLKIFLLD